MKATTSQLLLSFLLLLSNLQQAAGLTTMDLENERELLMLLSKERSQRAAVDSTGLKCGGVPVAAETKRSGFTVRIVGGRDAIPGEQPWLVALKLKNSFFCGGSLVQPDVVVTASHCLAELSPNQLLTLNVVVGEYNLFQDEMREQTIPVASVEMHPEYNSNNNYNNDIALLHLATPVKYGTYAQPICLPHSDDRFEVGMLCVVSGWGLTSEGGSVAAKQKVVKLPIISHEVCSYALSSQGYNIDRSFLCAGYPSGGQDACQGDSGGPLACQLPSGCWVLVGVVSFGIGCARAWDNETLITREGSPGLFTRVSSKMDFLTKGTGSARGANTDECRRDGLLVSGSRGTIQFPHVTGENYTNNCICLWNITVAANKYIEISFSKMDIENSANCGFDYLTITSADKTLVDKVCGANLPSPLLVHSNKASVKFVSDYSSTATGFELNFTEVAVDGREDSGCGSFAQLTEPGIIDTINYPGVYTALTECNWLIQAPSEHVVQFVFEDFCLEYDKYCRYDNVALYDNEEKSVILATFCGCSLPSSVTSNGNIMRIRFASDQENHYRGFKARFKFIPTDLSVPKGTVNPPIGVKVQTPQAVGLDVCGVSPFASRWQSTRIVGGEEARPNSWPWQVTIRLKTSHRCGGTIIGPRWILTAGHCVTGIATPSSLTISAGVHDRCLKESHEQVRNVLAYFVHEDFNERTFDYDIALIRLNDSLVYNDYVREICLPSKNRVVAPSTVCVVTGWGSQAEGNRSVCRLQQLQLPVMDWNICRDVYFSEHFGVQLTKRMLCAGFLGGGKDACQGDSGGPMVCQNNNGMYIIEGIVSWGIGCAQPNTPGMYTWVSFFMDWIEGKMEAADQGSSRSDENSHSESSPERESNTQANTPNAQECVMQTITSSIGTLTSPGYPLGYSGGLSCTWKIPISPGSVLKLEVVDMSVETSEDCKSASISVCEIQDHGIKELDKLCGIQEHKTYVSNASLVKIQFLSTKPSSHGNHGFVAKYKLYGGLMPRFSDPVQYLSSPELPDSCADVVLTKNNGLIQSPGYPNNYSNNARCEWRIIANLTSVITIFVEEFNTEKAQYGCQDQLMIYEGTGEFKKLLHCPVLDMIPVVSRGSVDVASPYYPSTYPNKRDCKWAIYSQSGKQLKLDIHDLGTEYSPNCAFDWLRIYDGPNTSSRLLGNLCGNAKGITFRSTGNYLTLHFQTDQSVGDRGFRSTCTEVTAESTLGERSNTLNGSPRACGTAAGQPILNENCSVRATRSVQADEKHNPRVIGGWDACPSSFPWMVSLQTKRGKHFCGGCIISPTYVLTAAHCQVSLSDTRVLVGITSLEQANYNKYFVKNMYRPIEYSDGTFPPMMDIMLLELTAPLNIDPNSIVCLPEKNEQPSLTSECFVTGWGLTNATGNAFSTVLQQASVSLISNEECILYWDVDVNPINICTRKPGSSCMGDSGGPLICKSNGFYKVVGVISWGSSKCDTGVPAVYTRVRPFLSWIDEVMSNSQSAVGHH
ncbi:ovochymase-1 isoform X2 [Pleurodeles waltl]|uniref:ovochymase-1 isoform X2 n=1 Tax=Pleurodeles waltl TaxID=8319 RepID=UPI0037095298